MSWCGLVVRDAGVAHDVGLIGPEPDEAACARALFAALRAEGFAPGIVWVHDRGHGCLIEGRRGDERVLAIVWNRYYTSQGAAEIHYEREGALPKPSGALGPRRQLIIS